jgi:hypothetical protein
MLMLIGAMTLMTIAVLVPPTVAAAGTTSTAAPHTVLAFALVTPNTAVADRGGMMAAPGDWIAVTGGGIFTPATGAVHAGGGFVHHSADGTVHCEGTWTATALTGWTSFGVSREGRHGGVVSLLVTHHCTTMDEVHLGIPMTVTSTRQAPSGSGHVEGVTVGEFTRPTGGTVVIVGGWRA